VLKISSGVDMSAAQVRELVGPPLGEMWGFVARQKLGGAADLCELVWIRDGNIENYVERGCLKKGITPSLNVVELERIMGPRRSSLGDTARVVSTAVIDNVSCTWRAEGSKR
jgi:hypothetical protein